MEKPKIKEQHVVQKWRKIIHSHFLRLATLCLILTWSTLSVRGQEVKRFSVKNVSLKEAVQQLERTVDTGFFYEGRDLEEVKGITLNMENATLREILSRLLEGTGFTFEMIGGNVVISRTPQTSQAATPEQTVQPVEIKVLEKGTGNPLPGATAILKGTTTGGAADVDGIIRLANVEINAVIEISFVGKKSVELKIEKGKTIYHVELEEEASEMDEVVVTGYQTIVREKVTGATATVTSRQLEERYTTNILDNLEGRVAGLVTYGDKTLIRGSSSMYAETNPLLVVDGLPIEGSIEDLNPYDIESVTVLKDAAATAIYGARASNGVIVVTTKKATKEGKTEITFSGNLTIYEKKNMDYHDNFYMTPAEQVDVESDYWDYYFSSANTSVADPIASFQSSLNSYSYTPITLVQYAYYQHAIGELSDSELEAYKNELKQNNFAKEYGKHALRRQFLQQYNVAIRTRTEKFNSSLVLNLKRDNNGIINSYDNQLNISYKTSYQLKRWLTTNFTFNGIISKTKESASAWATNPFNVPAYYRLLNNDGSYNYYSTPIFNEFYTQDDENPALKTMNFNHLEELHKDSRITNRRNMRYQGELLFKIIDGLTVNASFVYETERQNISNYSEADSYVMRMLRNAYTTRQGTAPDYTYEYMIPEQGGKLTTEDIQGEYWTARGQLNFQRTFAEKHSVDFLGGFEFRETKNKGIKSILLGYDDQLQAHSTLNVSFPDLYDYMYSTFFCPGFPSQQYGYSEYIKPYIGLDQEEWHRYASGYMNLTYTYDGRYNLFASFRKDYADLFGANSKFRGKPLWSIGASWNMNNEFFMENIAWINNLKLRVSYGKTGNIYQGATSYMTANTGEVNRYTHQPIARIDSPANPNLKWEKTTTTNVGIDFSLFNYRLRGSLDYYHKKGTDIFSRRPLDITTGFYSMNMNVADMKNNGVEVSLSYDWFRPAEENGFTWTTSMTLAYNKNEITHLAIQASSPWELVETGFRTGYPSSALFSYRYAGLDQTGEIAGQGQPLWYTSDGRKVGFTIQSESLDCLVYSGQTEPKISMAMDNTLRYRRFYLNFMAVYYGGHKMRARQYEQLLTFPYGALADYYVDSWTPENTDTDVPGIGQYKAFGALNTINNAGDIFVRPADFIKIRNVTLGYAIPASFTDKIGINNLRVTFQLDNIPALWKRNNVGVDPETLGIREQMTYILGLNFNF